MRGGEGGKEGGGSRQKDLSGEIRMLHNNTRKHKETNTNCGVEIGKPYQRKHKTMAGGNALHGPKNVGLVGQRSE